MENNNKINLTFMAIAAGKQTQISEVKLLQGIGVCSLVAINPTKTELEKLYGSTLEKDPEYIFTNKDGVKSARIELHLKLSPEHNNGIDAIKRISFFIRDAVRTNKDNTKVQVINAYGDTAWLTKEEFQAGKSPAYNPEWCTKGMRVCYGGEEEFVGFVKKFLAIPNYSFIKADGVREYHPSPELCECQFTQIKKFFTGDIQEVIIPLMALKDNLVKILFGVRTTPDNKTYQDAYTKFILSVNTKSYTRLEKDVEETQKNGGYDSTDFGKDFSTLKIWKPVPASFNAPTEAPIWGATPQVNPLTNFTAAPGDNDLPWPE